MHTLMTRPLPTHREWWVVRTPEGPKAVDHRPNTSAGAIGPFCTQMTADLKIAELAARDADKRLAIRAVSFGAGLATVLVAAAVLLP